MLSVSKNQQVSIEEIVDVVEHTNRDTWMDYRTLELKRRPRCFIKRLE
jgi:hypothetical protein